MKRILCFGDSNTWGCNGADFSRYPEHVRWTGLLADALGPDYRVIEEGLNGRTTAFSDLIEPERCAIEHVMPILLSAMPVDLIIVMLGTNDAKTHFHVNSTEIGYGLEELLLKMQYILRKSHSKAEFLVIAPPNMAEEYDRAQLDDASFEKIHELGPIYKAIADNMGMHYLNAWNLHLATGVDGLHLNEKGHAALAEAVLAKVKEIL